MKIAIATFADLPSPPVKGGAVETLIDIICQINEKKKKIDIDLFSIADKNAEIKAAEYHQTEFVYYQKYYSKKINVKSIAWKLFKKSIPDKTMSGITSLINKEDYDFVIITSINNEMEYIFRKIHSKVIWYLHGDPLSVLSTDAIERITNQCYSVITVSDFVKSRVKSAAPGCRAVTVRNCTDLILKVVIPNRIGANFSIDNLLDYLLFNQTSPDSNHLWYLIALIYVLILVRLFNDKLSIKCKIIIMSLCFLLSLVLGVYSSIFFGHALPEKYTMNFLFTGLPFFLLGELLSNVYERKNRWMRNQRFLLACSLISLLLMIFEWKIVHSRYPDGPQNIYVFTIISSVTVFLYFMSCKGNCILGLIGKDHSSTIYVVHMMVYMTISIATNVLGVNYLFSVIAPIIVFGVSLTYSIIWQRAKRFALRRIP